MSTNSIELKKELCRLYYMQGEKQKVISAHIGVPEKTISIWVTKYGWDVIRASCNISRAELARKALFAINTILEDFIQGDDPKRKIDADKLCKLAKVVENIDSKNGMVGVIETFMAFNKWMQARMSFDGELSVEFIKKVNSYQDLYIQSLMVNK